MITTPEKLGIIADRITADLMKNRYGKGVASYLALRGGNGEEMGDLCALTIRGKVMSHLLKIDMKVVIEVDDT